MMYADSDVIIMLDEYLLRLIFLLAVKRAFFVFHTLSDNDFKKNLSIICMFREGKPMINRTITTKR